MCAFKQLNKYWFRFSLTNSLEVVLSTRHVLLPPSFIPTSTVLSLFSPRRSTAEGTLNKHKESPGALDYYDLMTAVDKLGKPALPVGGLDVGGWNEGEGDWSIDDCHVTASNTSLSLSNGQSCDQCVAYYRYTAKFMTFEKCIVIYPLVCHNLKCFSETFIKWQLFQQNQTATKIHYLCGECSR